MTVLSKQTLILRSQQWDEPIKSMILEKRIFDGLSYGLSGCGYDIRIAQKCEIRLNEMKLASSLEEFNMPQDLVGIVHDKSSWARRGIFVQNTIIEPGWRGYLTLEISSHRERKIIMNIGTPIAQILFHRLDEAVEQGYSGKYQDQPSRPVETIYE